MHLVPGQLWSKSTQEAHSLLGSDKRQDKEHSSDPGAAPLASWQISPHTLKLLFWPQVAFSCSGIS